MDFTTFSFFHLPLPTPTRFFNQIPSSAKTPPSFPSVVFNFAEFFINSVIEPPLRPATDPKNVLSKNYAPVTELPPWPCQIELGPIPPCLHGAYIRNGPNPQFLPLGPHHLFDGDGMVHSLRITPGGAKLCSRYIKTNKFNSERAVSAPIVPNIFSGFNTAAGTLSRISLFLARVAAGQFNLLNGVGSANTSVARFGGKLFAMGESDAPYEIIVLPEGEILTVGRHDFDGELKGNMTAHPKIDGDTGEAFAFRIGPIPPFLNFFRVNRDGTKEPDVPIFSMMRPSFLHDFAITKSYAVFIDTQLGMNVDLRSLYLGSPKSMVGADQGKVPRIGVIPRYAMDDSEMRWFEAAGFNPVHAINAWEEKEDTDTVVIIAPNVLSVEHTMERMDLVHSSIEMAKVDLRTGSVWRRPLSAMNLDFAVINPAYIGKKNRYVYAGVGDPMPSITGVVKLDLEATVPGNSTAAKRMFGERCYGGEPFFVARENENWERREEDDGYVVTFMHDEVKGESRFLVMDAKSPELEVVAAVKMPQRIPCGFHGLFVKEDHLK